MIATGFVLFVIGWVGGVVAEPSSYSWDWRDLVSTVPGLVGLVLVVAGVARWLWLVAP